MRIPRIFQNIPLEINAKILLDMDATRHLGTVLRLSNDAKIILFNGDGYEYPSIIHFSKRKVLEATIQDRVAKNVESPLFIHLGQVISKGPHMELTIQKSVELGVTVITPLYSTRGDVHLKSEREERKLMHWQKIIIHACEQCGRTHIPKLEHPIPILEWVKNRQENTKLVLDHRATHTLKTIACTKDIALLIGPEGGLSPEEISYITHNAFINIQLGPRVLRTETASIVALSALQYLAGDLGS